MSESIHRSMDHESVLIVTSCGVGIAKFHHGDVIAVIVNDHRGDDWTILLNPPDAFRLAQSVLACFGEIMEIPGPKPPTDEQIRQMRRE